MGHEIKFRAWDNGNNEYFKTGYDKKRHGHIWCCVSNSGEFVSGIDDETDEPPYEKRFEIEWYAGLKDKNGKDLDWWEGDLLKDGDDIIEIIYDRGCFWAKSAKNSLKVPLYKVAELARHFKKIGNIHDNPELLKGDK